MAIPITEHPQYGAEMAKYQTAKTTAAESGDPAQAAKAESDWSNTVIRLQNDMFDRQQAEQARQAAVAQAHEIMPGIPDAVLAPYTDPQQIIDAAKALKEQAEKNLPAGGGQQPQGQQPAGQQPQGAAPSWGGGAPTSAGQTPADPNDPKAWQERMSGLADEVQRDVGRKPQAAEEFSKEFFDKHIAPGMFPPGYYQQRTGLEPKIDRSRAVVGERGGNR